jgi:cellulose synthase (UDP-forming)
MFSFTTWYPRYHNPEGILIEKVYSVDVFITTCGEPLDLLRQTVEGALAVEYQPKTIYILDDKADPKVKEMAESLGVRYLARSEHQDAKAGNLNYGLAHSNGDLILTLDADQVPSPQILSRLVGYFKIPKIGFAQSKQNFLVPKGDPFGNTDKVFYNVMQCGKDYNNAAFSCGSGVIYRRKALDEIGGFSTWNLVEDVHTSFLLHENGWRSVYYNHPLSIGSAPTDVRGVYRQRRQWAADSLRLMFWDNPLRRKSLDMGQRLQYFNLGFVYLVSGFVMPIFFLTPIWSILTSTFVLTAPVPSYIVHRLPYFIAMSVAYGSLNYPTSYLHAYQMWTGLFPVFIHATWTALRHPRAKPVYRVNVKKTLAKQDRPALVPVIPQLAVILACVLAIIYGLFYHPGALDFRLLNCAWATWAIWTLSGICVAALFRSPWEKEVVAQPWFTPRQVINNVLALVLFLFVFLLAATIIWSLAT